MAGGEAPAPGLRQDGRRGAYQASASSPMTSGCKLISAATEMTGQVTGVDFTGSEPVLIVGGARVNLSAVLSVRAITEQAA